MDPKTKRIYKEFDGKLIGSQKLKLFVCKTILALPKEHRHFITSFCWFMGSMDDAWAYTFTGNDLHNHHLIFISDELLKQDDHQIYFSIAHEIGHVLLKHRNSVVYQQTKGEILRQEEEADAFANTYIP